MRRPRRQPQGPPAATRSGSARVLTPTPVSTCAPLPKTAPNWRSPRSWPAPLLQGWPAEDADCATPESGGDIW